MRFAAGSINTFCSQGSKDGGRDTGWVASRITVVETTYQEIISTIKLNMQIKYISLLTTAD